MDKFSGDITDEVARLRAEVNELKAIIRARPALTAASQGWLMTNMSIPSVSSGTCHIGCNAGEAFSVNSAGVVKRMHAQGSAATYPTSFTSPATVVTGPTPQNYNDLRADAAMLQVCLRSVINVLEAPGYLAPH